MIKKESLDLTLPVEQIEYIKLISKLAGVSVNSTASVLIAIQLLGSLSSKEKAP